MLLIVVYFIYSIHPYAGPEYARSELTTGPLGLALFAFVQLALLLFGSISCQFLSTFKYNRSFSYILLPLVLASALFFVLLLMGGRGRAITPFLLLFICYHYFVRFFKFRNLIFYLSTVFLLFLVLPKVINGSGLVEVLFNVVRVDSGGSRTFDSLYNLSGLIQKINANSFGFSYGNSLINDVLGDLNLEKYAWDTRDYIMQGVYGFKTYTSSFPATKPGEFYIAFGSLGILFGGFFVGSLCSLIYKILIVDMTLSYYSIPTYLALMKIIAVPGGYLFNNIVKILLSLFVSIVFILFLEGGSKFTAYKSSK
ncbi:O-antigen polymerase [Synechococcus sp. MU1655]|uniref:O-antigen polymerase n=1 Tax=Synechococcus sp. MU1655 TaxID=2508355 RepID=UPI002026FF5E|nr:O-antigen polymerase [Synechococcus sp. MU1655]